MSQKIKLRTIVLLLTERYALGLELEPKDKTDLNAQKILIQKELTLTAINQVLENKVPKHPVHKTKTEQVLKSLCLSPKEKLIVEGKFHNFDVPVTEAERGVLFALPTKEKTTEEIDLSEKVLWTTKRERAGDEASILTFRLYIFITTIQYYCTEGTAFLDDEEEILVKEFLSSGVIKTENYRQLKGYSNNYGIGNIIQVLNNKFKKYPVPGKTFEGKTVSFYFASRQPLNIQHHELEFELRKIVRVLKRETIWTT
jgi:hypothetical protein